MFKLKKINDLYRIYYSDILCGYNLEHFFTSRDFVIKENPKIVSDYLNIDKEKLIKPHQVHSDIVKKVTDEKDDYNDCDALIIDSFDCAIYLNFADCVPVILYDKKNHIGAIAHAGWRGCTQRIAPKTVIKMNSNPKDIIAIIGPCISFSEFETYDEALKLLKDSVEDKKELFKNNYADLKGINKRQLVELGVKAENIDICPYCTVKDNDKFFSYRKENKTKNRHSAVLKLNS